MTTIKSYTDLEQSKKLAEILPLESADGFYEAQINSFTNKWEDILFIGNEWASDEVVIPAWSLAALLDNIPQAKLDSIKQHNQKLWRCCAYYVTDWHNSDWYDNPIDACYEMVIKLHEKKLL